MPYLGSMVGRNPDAIVVGGGVIGASVAFHLAREGIDVLLLEREALGSGASGAAAGMLTPSGEASDRGPFFHWALRSLRRFPALCAELLERSGVDPEFVRSGTLHLALDEPEARSLRERIARLGEADMVWLEAEAARQAEPQIAPDCVGAVWSPEDGHVRSPLLARAYAAAAQQLGARIETGVEVVGLLRDGDRVTGVATASARHAAPRVVLCAGAWSGLRGAWGEDLPTLPVSPVRGQILSLESPPRPLSTIVWGLGGYVVPKRDGSVVVGATEEEAGFDVRVTGDGLRRMLDLGPRLVPALADCTFHSAWAGLRPRAAGGLPLIGPLPGVEGLAVATGHFRNGVLLSPITGELVAGWVAGKGIPEDAEAFLPERSL